MHHIYEVLVDIKKYRELVETNAQLLETRYEIGADTKDEAYGSALTQATSDYPQATEYNVRVTRLLL